MAPRRGHRVEPVPVDPAPRQDGARPGPPGQAPPIPLPRGPGDAGEIGPTPDAQARGRLPVARSVRRRPRPTPSAPAPRRLTGASLVASWPASPLHLHASLRRVYTTLIGSPPATAWLWTGSEAARCLTDPLPADLPVVLSSYRTRPPLPQLGDPRPDLIGGGANGDGTRRGEVGVRDEVIAGEGPAELRLGRSPPEMPGPDKEDIGGGRANGSYPHVSASHPAPPIDGRFSPRTPTLPCLSFYTTGRCPTWRSEVLFGPVRSDRTCWDHRHGPGPLPVATLSSDGKDSIGGEFHAGGRSVHRLGNLLRGPGSDCGWLVPGHVSPHGPWSHEADPVCGPAHGRDGGLDVGLPVGEWDRRRRVPPPRLGVGAPRRGSIGRGDRPAGPKVARDRRPAARSGRPGEDGVGGSCLRGDRGDAPVDPPRPRRVAGRTGTRMDERVVREGRRGRPGHGGQRPRDRDPSSRVPGVPRPPGPLPYPGLLVLQPGLPFDRQRDRPDRGPHRAALRDDPAWGDR